MTFAFRVETARLPRPRHRRRNFREQCGDGATNNHFTATVVEAEQLSRSEWRRCYFLEESGEGETFQNRVETARLRNNSLRPILCGAILAIRVETSQTTVHKVRLSKTRRRRHDFPDRGGDGATKKQFLVTKEETTRFFTRLRNNSLRPILCGAILAIRVETSQTTVHKARLSRTRRRRHDFPDRGGDGATKKQFLVTNEETTRFFTRLRNNSLRPIFCGAILAIRVETSQTTVHKARLSRTRRRRHDFPDRGGDGATKKQFLVTKEETTRFFRPKRRRRDFLDQDGDGAIFQTDVETARPKLYSSRLRCIRCDFSDQCGEGATFQTIAETARPRSHSSRPRRRRRDFPDQGGDGATFQTTAETEWFSRPMRRLCDKKSLCDRGGRDASLPIRVETAQTTVHMACFSRTMRRRRDFHCSYLQGVLLEDIRSLVNLT